MAEIIPFDDTDDARAEEVIRALLLGKKETTIARRLGMSVEAVEAVGRRYFQPLTEQNIQRKRLMQVGIMERIQSVALQRLEEVGDVSAGALAVRAGEQISAIAGLNAATVIQNVPHSEGAMSTADALAVVREVKAESDAKKAKLAQQIEAFRADTSGRNTYTVKGDPENGGPH